MYRNLLIAVAVFGLGWGASFGAGVAFGRRGGTPAVQAANAPGAQLAGGQFTQGGRADQAAGRTGVVQSLDGRTLTLTGANNQPTKVTLTDQTQILKLATGTASDLAPGTRVSIQPQGQPAADGSVTAAMIQIVPEGAAGAFAQFAGQGAQQGGQRAAQQGAQGAQGGQAQRQPAGR